MKSIAQILAIVLVSFTFVGCDMEEEEVPEMDVDFEEERFEE